MIDDEIVCESCGWEGDSLELVEGERCPCCGSQDLTDNDQEDDQN